MTEAEKFPAEPTEANVSTPQKKSRGHVLPPNAGKIDPVEMHDLVLKGLSNSEIARHFDVHPSSVTRARKRLDLNAAKSVQMVRADAVISKQLATWQQLQKVNADAHEMLEQCMKWMRGDPEAIQILESQMRKVKVRGKEEEVTEYKFTDPRDIALKAMARIEAQLKLQNETLAMIANMKAIHEFQEELVQLLKEVDPSVKEEFVRRLRERRSLSSAIQ